MFLNLSQLIEQILVEHIDMKKSSSSKLRIYSFFPLKRILEIGISRKSPCLVYFNSNQYSKIKKEFSGRKTIKLTDVTAYLDSESKYDYLEGALTGKTGCLHGLTK